MECDPEVLNSLDISDVRINTDSPDKSTSLNNSHLENKIVTNNENVTNISKDLESKETATLKKFSENSVEMDTNECRKSPNNCTKSQESSNIDNTISTSKSNCIGTSSSISEASTSSEKISKEKNVSSSTSTTLVTSEG